MPESVESMDKSNEKETSENQPNLKNLLEGRHQLPCRVVIRRLEMFPTEALKPRKKMGPEKTGSESKNPEQENLETKPPDKNDDECKKLSGETSKKRSSPTETDASEPDKNTEKRIKTEPEDPDSEPEIVETQNMEEKFVAEEITIEDDLEDEIQSNQTTPKTQPTPMVTIPVLKEVLDAIKKEPEPRTETEIDQRNIEQEELIIKTEEETPYTEYVEPDSPEQTKKDSTAGSKDSTTGSTAGEVANQNNQNSTSASKPGLPSNLKSVVQQSLRRHTLPDIFTSQLSEGEGIKLTLKAVPTQDPTPKPKIQIRSDLMPETNQNIATTITTTTKTTTATAPTMRPIIPPGRYVAVPSTPTNNNHTPATNNNNLPVALTSSIAAPCPQLGDTLFPPVELNPTKYPCVERTFEAGKIPDNIAKPTPTQPNQAIPITASAAQMRMKKHGDRFFKCKSSEKDCRRVACLRKGMFAHSSEKTPPEKRFLKQANFVLTKAITRRLRDNNWQCQWCTNFPLFTKKQALFHVRTQHGGLLK